MVRSVVAAGVVYLRIVGPVTGAVGLLIMLFFASQGWSRMAPPLFTSLLRLTLTLAGGWIALSVGGAGLSALFGMLAAATVIAGATLTLLVWRRMGQASP